MSGGRWQRARQRLAHSIKLRLVLVFLVLAAAMSGVFVVGAQKAFSLGWREAARPLLRDYVDRLAAEVAGPAGGPPSVARAQALTERLPLTITIDGPVVQWASHPYRPGREARAGGATAARDWVTLLERRSADGHTVRFGIDEGIFERRPRASRMPSGSEATIPTPATTSVTISPPHFAVSTCWRRNSPQTTLKAYMRSPANIPSMRGRLKLFSITPSNVP